MPVRRPAVECVIVHPGSRLHAYQSLAATLAAIEPPVWAGLIATYLRGRGHSVAIIDGDAEELTPEETAERVALFRPRLTAIIAYGQHPSASTQTMPAVSAVARAVKQRTPEVPVILVGGHVAALPDRTLTEEAADFVCGGEGPVTVDELLRALQSTARDDVSNVRGLYYQHNGRVAFNRPAPLVHDLDAEMPAVAWDLLPMTRYRSHNWHAFGSLVRQPYASLYTTLGCPFNCSFCCIQAPFKSGEQLLGHRATINTYRFWGVDAVMNQIDALVRDYGVTNIKFADEMFVLNDRHISAICDAIASRGYRLNIWAYARVDTVKPGMAEKLKGAGFHWLAFGVESANSRVLADVSKRFEQAQVIDTLKRVRAAGINVVANYIFGLPEDDTASMQETLDLAVETNTEWANFYSAMAYPGLRLYREALEHGWPLPDSWSGYAQHSFDCLPLPTRYVGAGEVLSFRDRAFAAYFGGDRYQSMIGQKFGPETVTHVRKMLEHQLPRRHATSRAA